MKKKIAKEKDFQEVTNESAIRAIGDMREELDSEESCELIASEGALSVEVGGRWTPGETPEPSEYFILLGTGGPASRIRGELDDYKQPTSAIFEYQDWFKPWTAANNLTIEQETTLLQYASQFYFGE